MADGVGISGGAIITRFGSLSEEASLSAVLFFSFSFWAALRASLSLRSFSLRNALDSNSCQSPLSSLSLFHGVS